MARDLKTISARMVIAVLLIQAVMLPLLSYAILFFFGKIELSWLVVVLKMQKNGWPLARLR